MTCILGLIIVFLSVYNLIISEAISQAKRSKGRTYIRYRLKSHLKIRFHAP